MQENARRELVRRAARTTARALGTVAVAVAGIVLGVLLLGRVPADVGPLRTTMSATLDVSGGATVGLPPVGSLRVDSHAGPLGLRVDVEEVDVEQARTLLGRPLDEVEHRLVADVRGGVTRLAVRVAAASLATTALLALLVYRRRRVVALVVCAAVLVQLSLGGLVWASFRPAAITEPEFRGLVAAAPSAIGDVEDVVARFEHYRSQLRRLVGNMTDLYQALGSLPTYRADESTLRVLHVSDLHLNPAAFDVMATVVERFDIDVVVDTGDMTDWGSEPETSFVRRIAGLGVPYVYVRGNHDSARTQAAVAAQPNAVVLDGAVRTVAGLRMLGFGDPRFTPDKTSRDSEPEGQQAAIDAARATVASGFFREPAGTVDLVAVHDPDAAEQIVGEAPLVLAGHRHEHSFRTVRDGHLLVGGSTGGAGLRGLEHGEPTPLSMSVLLFDRATRRLRAVDHLTVGGLGLTSVRIDRKVVADPARPAPAGSPSQRAATATRSQYGTSASWYGRSAGSIWSRNVR